MTRALLLVVLALASLALFDARYPRYCDQYESTPWHMGAIHWETELYCAQWSRPTLVR